MGVMLMSEDEELERIRSKKLKNLFEKASHKRKAGEPQTPHDESILGKPVEVTDSSFEEVIRKSSLVVIDCWAAWCAPCRMIAPILEEMAREYAGKILFGKLNVDENRQVAMSYQIMSIPTLLVFKNGNLVDRIVGVMPRSILEPRITRHL